MAANTGEANLGGGTCSPTMVAPLEWISLRHAATVLSTGIRAATNETNHQGLQRVIVAAKTT